MPLRAPAPCSDSRRDAAQGSSLPPLARFSPKRTLDYDFRQPLLRLSLRAPASAMHESRSVIGCQLSQGQRCDEICPTGFSGLSLLTQKSPSSSAHDARVSMRFFIRVFSLQKSCMLEGSNRAAKERVASSETLRPRSLRVLLWEVSRSSLDFKDCEASSFGIARPEFRFSCQVRNSVCAGREPASEKSKGTVSTRSGVIAWRWSAAPIQWRVVANPTGGVGECVEDVHTSPVPSAVTAAACRADQCATLALPGS